MTTAAYLTTKQRRARVGDSPHKGKSVAGRQREHEPDPTTPAGQWALWLRTKLPKNCSADDLAEATGTHRSTVHKWLNGEAVPHIDVWDALAAYLRLPGWWSLCPTPQFIASLSVPTTGRKSG